MVLNSEEAVKAFSRGGNVTIGGSVSAAAGPIGTGGQVGASLVNPAPIFSYSRSKGECPIVSSSLCRVVVRVRSSWFGRVERMELVVDVASGVDPGLLCGSHRST